MSDDQAEAIVNLLRTLVADVAALRAATAGRLAGTLSGADRRILEKLLPAISDALGNASWSASGLFEHAELLDIQLGAELRQILGAEPSRKAIGKLLARGAGLAIAGLEIERVARTRAGVLWRVSARV